MISSMRSIVNSINQINPLNSQVVFAGIGLIFVQSHIPIVVRAVNECMPRMFQATLGGENLITKRINDLSLILFSGIVFRMYLVNTLNNSQIIKDRIVVNTNAL